MALPHNYGNYLRLPELLSCQNPPSRVEGERCGPTREYGHPDELLFIIVHQVFELWFKQMLFELDRFRDLLGQPETQPSERRVEERMIPQLTELLGRVNEILRLCHDQFTVIETMPSTHFLAFRDLLGNSSGFQSLQFREFEILLGLSREARERAVAGQSRLEGIALRFDSYFEGAERQRLEEAASEMSVSDAVLDWLARTPVESLFPGFEADFLAAHVRYGEDQLARIRVNPKIGAEAIKQARLRTEAGIEELRQYLRPGSSRAARLGFLFISSYRTQPLLRAPSSLIETLIELEERVRLFRYRHARMVERMIGRRVGTGGSPGVEYLDRTAVEYRLFEGLLEGRSYLLDPARLPAPPDEASMDFAFGGGE
ncbi:MAG: hypothetical protein CSA62_14880 [Planctomycetota bacterium]|nr:MAG: hypothetical protein CSA62_14880 [Planctomycetota bacterium]